MGRKRKTTFFSPSYRNPTCRGSDRVISSALVAGYRPHPSRVRYGGPEKIESGGITLQGEGILCQRASQLRCILKMNRAQTQFARTLEVYFAIVDEEALVRCALRRIQDCAINGFVGFTQTQETRTEEDEKVFG